MDSFSLAPSGKPLFLLIYSIYKHIPYSKIYKEFFELNNKKNQIFNFVVVQSLS